MNSFKIAGQGARGWGFTVAQVIVAVGFTGVGLAQTQVYEPIPPPSMPNTAVSGLNNMSGVLHAKATPDEWFCSAGGSGLTTGLLDANGLDVQVPFDLYLNPNPTNKCLPGGEYAGSPRIPKVNQGYVWGTTLVNGYIFFGTAANGQCVTEGGVTGGGTAYNSGAWTCQFGDSPYVPFPLPAQIGDNRPPRFYKYNISTGITTDITPKMQGNPPPNVCGTYTSQNPFCLEPLWYATRGIRAVTNYTETTGQGAGHTFILVSGPALSNGNNKLNYFAYDMNTSTWVAESQLSGYNDARHWTKDSYGTMYLPAGKGGQGGGSLLRYYGNFQNIPPPLIPSGGNGYASIPSCGAGLVFGPPSPGSYSCFNFADVGDIDGVGTDVAIHEGRVFVATWTIPGLAPDPGTPCTPAGCFANVNNVIVPFPYAGLWMSPAIPVGGLTSANAGPSGGWTKPWNALMYEPDPVVATSYGTGAISDYNGVLYFGTMNVPYISTGRISNFYGKPTDQSLFGSYISKTWRAASLFSGNGFTTGTPTINVLYGFPQYYVYAPGADVNSFTFTLTNNNMGGAAPLYGQAGFGNPYTNYIWSMGQFNGSLYVGTMNWGFMAATTGALLSPSAVVNISKLIPPSTYGAALYYFTNTTSKAIAQSTTGVGNYLNYGVRNIIPYTYPNGTLSLFIGSANAMNLSTTGSGPKGGWELIELKGGSTVTKR